MDWFGHACSDRGGIDGQASQAGVKGVWPAFIALSGAHPPGKSGLVWGRLDI
jgi:beta-glucanase (GH16 family)